MKNVEDVKLSTLHSFKYKTWRYTLAGAYFSPLDTKGAEVEKHQHWEPAAAQV